MAKRSVTIEFSDISPLYPNVWATFRYPVSYSPSEEDTIVILKAEEAHNKKSLAVTKIGNPEGHWMVDSSGMTARAGKLSLDVRHFSPGDQVQLEYISGQGAVLGTSEIFCLTSGTPRSLGSSWDSGSRPHSEQLSVIGSSFTNVSSPQMSAEFVDVGMAQPPLNTSDFVDVRSSPQPISDFVNIQPKSQLSSSFTMVTDETSIKPPLTDYEVVNSQTQSAEPQTADNFTVDINRLSLEPSVSEPLQSEVSPQTPNLPEEIESRPSPVPRKSKQEDTIPPPNLLDLQEVVEQTNPSSVELNSALLPETEPSSELVPSPVQSNCGPEMLQSSVPHMPVDPSMSASTVFVEQFTSQKEAKVLKNNNRDLMQKIKKLSARLQDMQLENQALEEKIAESELKESNLSDLESRQKQNEVYMEKLKEQIEVLSAENRSLKEKISVLRSDCKTQNDRNAKLLSKIQEAETLNTVLASENAVLKVKVHQLEEQVQKLKRKEHRKRDGERPPPGKKETREPREHKNHHMAASKPAKKDHQASRPKAYETETKPSDDILQEVKPKPRAHHHHHRTILDDPKHSKPAENRQPPKTSRPTQLPLGSGASQPTPAPRHSKATRKEPEDQHYPHRETKESCVVTVNGVKPEKDSSLSETRIQEIVSQRRGEELDDIKPSSPVAQCPICKKQLFARETDYGVQLHVEHCLAQLSS